VTRRWCGEIAIRLRREFLCKGCDKREISESVGERWSSLLDAFSCHNLLNMAAANIDVPLDASGFLELGLKLVGFNPTKGSEKKRRQRYLAFFGTTPEACNAIFSDLQTTDIEEASVTEPKSKYFLMAMHWLKAYNTEELIAALFNVHEDTVRKWVWFYTVKIQHLKKAKISWDVIENAVEAYVESDDGVHCRVNEPRTDPSTKWSSKKYGKKAALTYEVGLAIHFSQCVLINGPHPASTHDLTMFHGPDGAGPKLKDGQKAVVDRLYTGGGDKVAIRNEFDTDEVREFKKRVRARHESFNSRIKSFKVLDSRFRNRGGCRIGLEGVLETHKAAFEAVCVIVQYDMENGRPLFDA